MLVYHLELPTGVFLSVQLVSYLFPISGTCTKHLRELGENCNRALFDSWLSTNPTRISTPTSQTKPNWSLTDYDRLTCVLNQNQHITSHFVKFSTSAPQSLPGTSLTLLCSKRPERKSVVWAAFVHPFPDGSFCFVIQSDDLEMTKLQNASRKFNKCA